jgi:thiamine pyrophosphokinase
MDGLIISSGSIKDYNILNEVIKDKNFILCADGGIAHSINMNIVPNAVIGDLDSINQMGRDFIKEHNIPIIKFPVEKDETDTELAILYLIENNIKNITLIGATGSRLDHTIGNIYLLKRIKQLGAVGKIVDDNNSIYLVHDYIKLKGKKGYYLSIIPITQDGLVVTLKGFYYPLNEDFIGFGTTLGISNRIIHEYGEIKIIKGEALIIEAKD